MPEGETKSGRVEAEIPTQMIVAGIDPGKTGAMVILFPDGSTTAHRVPLMKLRGKERPAWTEWQSTWATALDFAGPDLIVIEEVAARPGQGVTSMFNFGQALGFVRAISCGVGCRVLPVTPAVWKGKLGLLKSDKNASRETARRLVPSIASEITRVKDDGVAEAALLAYWGDQFS